MTSASLTQQTTLAKVRAIPAVVLCISWRWQYSGTFIRYLWGIGFIERGCSYLSTWMPALPIYRPLFKSAWPIYERHSMHCTSIAPVLTIHWNLYYMYCKLNYGVCYQNSSLLTSPWLCFSLFYETEESGNVKLLELVYHRDSALFGGDTQSGVAETIREIMCCNCVIYHKLNTLNESIVTLAEFLHIMWRIQTTTDVTVQRVLSWFLQTPFPACLHDYSL